METAGFFIGMLSGAIFLTYLYNQSGGKTALPILWHTTWNIASLIAFATIPETAYVLSTFFMSNRSAPSFYAPRGMSFQDALRRVHAERYGGHSHVERGNEMGK